MSAPAAMLLSELWLSFSSLLRSYVAAAGLNTGESAEITTGAESIAVAAGEAVLEFHIDGAGGTGKWRLSDCGRQTQGEFELLPEGRMLVDGMILDLDHAAIDFAALLWNAASRGSGRDL